MKQAPEIALHLKNPWLQELYRQYQAQLKYSPPLLSLNEEEINDASRTLDYLHSEKTRSYLESYPENKSRVEYRKRKAISCINHNKAAIAIHHASMRSMRDQLIRFGFLDEMGNSLFDAS